MAHEEFKTCIALDLDCQGRKGRPTMGAHAH